MNEWMNKQKVKVKLLQCLIKNQTTKTHDVHILNKGTSYKWVATFMLRPLYPWGKSLWSGYGGDEKDSRLCRDMRTLLAVIA